MEFQPALAIEGSRGAELGISLSAFEYEELLWAGIAKPQLPVEATTFGGHQVDPLHSGYSWSMEEFLDYTPAESMALQITRYHNIPENSAAVAIGAGASEAHKALATPNAHNRITPNQ